MRQREVKDHLQYNLAYFHRWNDLKLPCFAIVGLFLQLHWKMVACCDG